MLKHDDGDADRVHEEHDGESGAEQEFGLQDWRDTIDRPPSPSISTRSSASSRRNLNRIAWALYFSGEIFVLMWLWLAGSQAYNLDGRYSQIDSWIVDLEKARTAFLLCQSLLGIWILTRSLRGDVRLSTSVTAAIAGLIAAVGGGLMISRGSVSCFEPCAPSALLCRNWTACGQINQWFDRYRNTYRGLPMIVIAAGLALVVVAVLSWMIGRRTHTYYRGNSE